jgi:hypothetical protein
MAYKETPEIVEQIREMASQGLYAHAIGDKLDLHYTVIQKIVKRHNIPLRTLQGDRAEKEAKIAQLLRERLPYNEIEKLCNCHYDTVIKVAEKFDIKPNHVQEQEELLLKIQAVNSGDLYAHEIGAMIGADKDAVRLCAQKHGIVLKTKQSNLLNTKAKIKELVNEGKNRCFIESNAGTSYKTIEATIKEENLTLANRKTITRKNSYKCLLS